MEEKVKSLIKEICMGECTVCRGLEKAVLARKLMNFAHVPQNARIWEMTARRDNQVLISFTLPEDDNYYSLFAGIGYDGNSYFKMAMMGNSYPEWLFRTIEKR